MGLYTWAQYTPTVWTNNLTTKWQVTICEASSENCKIPVSTLSCWLARNKYMHNISFQTTKQSCFQFTLVLSAHEHDCSGLLNKATVQDCKVHFTKLKGPQFVIITTRLMLYYNPVARDYLTILAETSNCRSWQVMRIQESFIIFYDEYSYKSTEKPKLYHKYYTIKIKQWPQKNHKEYTWIGRTLF